MKYLSIRAAKGLCTSFVFLLVFSALSTAQEKKKFDNFQSALFSQFSLNNEGGPSSMNWIDDGKRYSFVDRGTGQILSYDIKKDKQEAIFTNADHTFPGTNDAFSYQSFEYSKDSKSLVFQTNFRPVYRVSGVSDYYLYSRDSKELKLVAKDARTGELSPDGSKFGYERDGNLFVFDIASGAETQLTDDAGPQKYNGRFGWVYEEEFSLAKGWDWSHDSKYIAFWQQDESMIPMFRSTDYSGNHPTFVEIPYPKVGDRNPDSRIGVVAITGGDVNWMDVPVTGEFYVPRIYWTAREGHLAIMTLNRAQTHLQVFLNDVTTSGGNAAKILDEQGDAWIDISDFFGGITHLISFPEGKEEFFWISDRDGFSHIYRYDYDGNLKNQVTSGEWEVTFVNGIDTKKKTIYYSSTEVSPLERQLYSIRFDGKRKKRLSETEGRHIVNMSPNSLYYIDRYSNINQPTKVALKTTKGKVLKMLTENQATQDFLDSNTFSIPEFIQFTNSDGVTLDVSVLKPADFDENRAYPLVLDVYGGPSAQSVYNQFSANGWHQWLVQNGYVVAQVNNRGSGGYGKAFEKVVFENLGENEAKDFAETAQHLATFDWIDGDNMAIRGHSYGGYISSLTMFLHPGVFKASIVTAPVTDWRLYDTIYTERYMGLLPENEAEYVKSAPITHASKLEGKMLLVHSSMDENVHMQNTMQLSKALIDAGKDVEMRIYPPGTHGVAYDTNSFVLLMRTYTSFLDRHLKGRIN